MSDDKSLLARAIFEAVEMHAGQFDKGGVPYSTHVLRVGLSLLPDEQAAIVGFFHDALEDCGEVETLIRRGDIRDEYGNEIADAVKLLTRSKDQSYSDYIAALSTHPLGRRVKIADLHDNMIPERLSAASRNGYHMEKLKDRYEKALSLLEKLESEERNAKQDAQ
jgi:(p)ppGpp synthase/HD superfamily hydrolase